MGEIEISRSWSLYAQISNYRARNECVARALNVLCPVFAGQNCTELLERVLRRLMELKEKYKTYSGL